jgi:glutamine synthetase type III
MTSVAAQKALGLRGETDLSTLSSSGGVGQEYFLVDLSLANARPDLRSIEVVAKLVVDMATTLIYPAAMAAWLKLPPRRSI